MVSERQYRFLASTPGSRMNSQCKACGTDVAAEWIAPILIAGRQLPGTGEWRNGMDDGLCPACFNGRREAYEKQRREQILRLRLLAVFGGERPYRDFRIDRFIVTDQNRRAYLAAQSFDPRRDNLYLWGPCGVGKTHLVCGIAHRAAEAGLSVGFYKPAQLLRRIRWKDADDEQRAVDYFVRLNVLILDDFGVGHDTPFARMILQEVIDSRDYQLRGGLVITSKFDLDALAERLGDDTVASRIAMMCRVFRIEGPDGRIKRAAEKKAGEE